MVQSIPAWISSSKSTEFACLFLISTIEHNRKNKLVTCAVSFDIKSAFAACDLILHCFIVNRCFLYLVKIIASYPSNWKTIIPQAVLGLKFPFSFNMIVYADDLVLLTNYRNISTAHNLQVICNSVSAWCKSVKMLLNGSKTILKVLVPEFRCFGFQSKELKFLHLLPAPILCYL